MFIFNKWDDDKSNVRRILLYTQVRARVCTTKRKSQSNYFKGDERCFSLGITFPRKYISRSSYVREFSESSALNVLHSLLCPWEAVKNLPFQKFISLGDKLTPIKKLGIVPRNKHKIRNLFQVVVMLWIKTPKMKNLWQTFKFQFFINHSPQEAPPKISTLEIPFTVNSSLSMYNPQHPLYVTKKYCHLPHDTRISCL